MYGVFFCIFKSIVNKMKFTWFGGVGMKKSELYANEPILAKSDNFWPLRKNTIWLGLTHAYRVTKFGKFMSSSFTAFDVIFIISNNETNQNCRSCRNAKVTYEPVKFRHKLAMKRRFS